ncbi:hypothetical protein [Halobacterium hubeiense]|uniref:hypothetical protein n=1 Tax=Halobacterium hubeiense TaxID=1407499 RepID=UPI000B7D95E0|nr:hypothetical protein [Halobacterium hubeiense]
MMKGAAYRLIKSQGREYDVLNASGGGGRDVPTYAPTGTLVGVLERRGRPRTTTDSAGEEVETDKEIRAIVEDVDLVEAGESNSYPTKLIHPDGYEYRVLDAHPEDSGVTVLAVLED